MSVGRKQVRETLSTFIAPPNVDGINQVFTSFPKRIDFQVNSLPSDVSRCAAVVFIENENETRLAIGGSHSGVKRIDYSIAIQLFHHSTQREAEDAMDDFDNVIDNLKDRLRSDHNFGDPTSTLVWQGAEPVISTSYGEPLSTNGAATETWAVLRFTVTQMIQA